MSDLDTLEPGDPDAINTWRANTLQGVIERLEYAWLFAEDEDEAVAVATDAIGKLICFDRPERWYWLRRLFQEYEEHSHIFWAMFLEWWPDSEFSRGHASRLQRVHRRRRAYEFMTPENKEFYDALPDPVTVYRGQEAGTSPGVSWTTDKAKAEWFAERFTSHEGRIFAALQGGARFANSKGKPIVLTGKIKKANVWAVFTDRNESEVLCRPTIVK
jgi:hypothetical protein